MGHYALRNHAPSFPLSLIHITSMGRCTKYFNKVKRTEAVHNQRNIHVNTKQYTDLFSLIHCWWVLYTVLNSFGMLKTNVHMKDTRDALKLTWLLLYQLYLNCFMPCSSLYLQHSKPQYCSNKNFAASMRSQKVIILLTGIVSLHIIPHHSWLLMGCLGS